MRRRWRILHVGLIVFVAAVAAVAVAVIAKAPAETAAAPGAAEEANPMVAGAKLLYRFADWPGKQGRVRPGVNVKQVLQGVVPNLTLARAARPANREQGLPDDVVEVWWFTRGQDNIEIRMWVAPTCEAAQEVLVRRLAARTNPTRPLSGSELGVELGDMSFPQEPSTTFVRGNLVFDVRAPTGDAIGISKTLDEALLATPSYDSFEQLDGYRPQIRELRLAEGVSQPLRVGGYEGESQEFPLVVDVVDPEGGPVFLYWETTGHMGAGKSVECTDSEYSVSVTVAPPDKVIQQQTVTLTAVNERGMFSCATLPIQVFVSEVQYHTEND